MHRYFLGRVKALRHFTVKISTLLPSVPALWCSIETPWATMSSAWILRYASSYRPLYGHFQWAKKQPFEWGLARSFWGRLEGFYCVALMFLMRTLSWTLLFVVNRQGWSNFTPWKVRQISVCLSASQGTGSSFSETGRRMLASMHSYVLGEKWGIKVYGEGVIWGWVSLVMTANIIFLTYLSFFRRVVITNENHPQMTPSP